MASRNLDTEIAEYISQATKPPEVGTLTREVPTRAPSITGDVWAPFLVALITGAVTFTLVGGICLIFDAKADIAFAAGGVGLALVWFLHVFEIQVNKNENGTKRRLRVRLKWDRLLWAVEEVSGVDVNQDGDVGKPREPWRIILETEQQQLWLNFDSEDLRNKAKLIAPLLLSGTPFSEAALTGTNRPLSRTEFQTLRDLFMYHGLLEWKDDEHHTLGIQWTPPGRSMLRQLAEISTTPARIRTPRTTDALPAQVGEGRGDG